MDASTHPTPLAAVEATDPNPGYSLSTIYASRAGYCRRHLYLSQLGLRADDGREGELEARRLIQRHLEAEIEQRCPQVAVSPTATCTDGGITWSASPTAVDYDAGVVYQLKPRNGWYKFHPPQDRHLDQLTVYMRAAGVDHGRLLYVNMADFLDTRTWPPPDHADDYVAFDADRYAAIVDRAVDVRDAILTHGVAARPGDVPFHRCGCYLCQEESLAFPTPDPDAGEWDQGVVGGASMPSAAMDGGTATAPAADHEPTPAGPPEVVGRVLEDADPAARVPVAPRGYVVPEMLKQRDIWVVYDSRRPIPKAPWETGTMYPVEWAADGDTDPRTSFEEASMVAELPPAELHRSWPFPSDDAVGLPDAVTPGVLLPHDPGQHPVTVMDLDDVRHPESGETTREAAAILEALGGFVEISQSGTGLHVFVRGGLPDGVAMAEGPLTAAGSIEIYESSRFIATTFRHAEGTPTTLPDAAEAVAALARGYSNAA